MKLILFFKSLIKVIFILEIIKSNNISNLINSPNSKNITPVFTEPKSLSKKNFTTKILVKELYQRKK